MTPDEALIGDDTGDPYESPELDDTPEEEVPLEIGFPEGLP